MGGAQSAPAPARRLFVPDRRRSPNNRNLVRERSPIPMGLAYTTGFPPTDRTPPLQIAFGINRMPPTKINVPVTPEPNARLEAFLIMTQNSGAILGRHVSFFDGLAYIHEARMTGFKLLGQHIVWELKVSRRERLCDPSIRSTYLPSSPNPGMIAAAKARKSLLSLIDRNVSGIRLYNRGHDVFRDPMIWDERFERAYVFYEPYSPKWSGYTI